MLILRWFSSSFKSRATVFEEFLPVVESVLSFDVMNAESERPRAERNLARAAADCL